MNSFEEVFDLVKKNLDMTDIARNTFIEPIKPLRLNGNKAMLYVNSSFIKQVLQENYTEILKKQFENILGFEVQIMIQCDEDLPDDQKIMVNPIKELQDDHVIADKITKSEQNSNYIYTFDTFIQGESNKLAYAACKAITQKSGYQSKYNPLYIYGNPGLGKTHLLTAVKHEINRNNPEKTILFTPADSFISDFVNSIQSNKTMEFKNKYRNADVLLVDDVQFFAGKKESQMELFNTFNELHTNGKQIIFTSDRPPKEIHDMDNRLQSRFEWGLLADISVPEFETRVAIVERKAKLIGLEIQPTISAFIADKLKNNIRQLEGTITKMSAMSIVSNIKPTLAMAQGIVREILEENIPAPVTIDRIINEVASIYGFTNDELRSRKRSSDISTARQIAIYVSYKVAGASYTEIGKEFGGRDHSTIVCAVEKVRKAINEDKPYRNTIDDLIKNIGNLQNF